MSSRPVSPVPPKRQPPDVPQDTITGVHTVKIPPPRKSSILQEVLPPDESIAEKLLHQINGDEGAGFAISLIVHVIFIALLAIPVIQYTKEAQVYTTLVENKDDTIEFDSPIETSITLPIVDSSGGDPESDLLEMNFETSGALPILDLSPKTVTPSVVEATAGNDGSEAGNRIAEPENAVVAGNFSVWPWPLNGSRLNPDLKNLMMGEPGKDPGSNKNYLVIIRVRVPQESKFLKITDFSGSVVGSDGHTQIIPEKCFQLSFKGKTGQLIPIRSNPRIPVIDGTAEFVILVPGAPSLVEDTINIRSETLDEEQEIKLVFKPRD